MQIFLDKAIPMKVRFFHRQAGKGAEREASATRCDNKLRGDRTSDLGESNLERFGCCSPSWQIDVVVNNAGIAYMGPLEAFTLEQDQQQFDTNVFGVLRVNRAALPHMRWQGSGLLLQIGSISGRLALPFQGLYAATKFALEALTESYRYEMAPFGIDAAIIEPGTYPTPIETKQQIAADTGWAALYQAALDAFTTPLFAENRSATPPDPQEVADAVARVIAQPAGERPLHTVVAPVAQRQAPQAINDAVTQATRSFFKALDLPLATLTPKSEKQQLKK